MLASLFFVPIVAGAIMLLPWTLPRRALLVVTACLHALLTVLLLGKLAGDDPVPTALGGLLAPDPLGGLFLAAASLLFLAASVYAVGYLRDEERRGGHARVDLYDESRLFTNAPEGRFAACLCFFLAAMTLVTVTPHLGALWVGVEATTLAGAPLIYFHRHQRSLEATWKYLMICSVGIALALLGNILLSIAFHRPGGAGVHGTDQVHAFLELARQGAAQLPWLKAAFIFIFVGYGTKMGLAPFHNWLPDAHSEAPSMVSGLLSGALLNCAFLGILRAHQILLAAGQGDFSGTLLIFFGLVSMVFAAVFIVGQGHYKRMLAYSSVEHMGIMAVGVGVGGLAVFGELAGSTAVQGGLLHALSHSLVKCMLFLTAGNILTRYRSLSVYDVRGMRRTMPVNAVIWTAGFLAVTGAPPFGLFLSEFLILRALFLSELWLACAIYLTVLGVIFTAMSVPVLRMVRGAPPRDIPKNVPESAFSVLPPLTLGLGALLMGVYVPPPVNAFVMRGVSLLLGVE